MSATAEFEFFVRKLPQQRNFLTAAGLEQVLAYLEQLVFETENLEWLATEGHIAPDFVHTLAGLRFTGDVDAMPEGTVFFADEPILRITAPIAEAQLVESRVVNIVHLQTLIASKAARCVLTAPEQHRSMVTGSVHIWTYRPMRLPLIASTNSKSMMVLHGANGPWAKQRGRVASRSFVNMARMAGCKVTTPRWPTTAIPASRYYSL